MAKAKGTTLLGAVKFLRRHPEEARALLPENLHHYLEERVSQAAWYPEEALLALIRTMLKLLPGSERESLELMGRATAREHEETVYTHLLKGGATAVTAAALWSSQHDTGRLLVKQEEGRALRVELRNYAYPSREMCAIVGAYVAESLRMGGIEPSVEKLACALDDGDCCSWRFSWEDTAAPKQPPTGSLR